MDIRYEAGYWLSFAATLFGFVFTLLLRLVEKQVYWLIRMHLSCLVARCSEFQKSIFMYSIFGRLEDFKTLPGGGQWDKGITTRPREEAKFGWIPRAGGNSWIPMPDPWQQYYHIACQFTHNAHPYIMPALVFWKAICWLLENRSKFPSMLNQCQITK